MVKLRRWGPKPRPTVHDRMTLAEHLAELRRRLIICLIAVGIGGVIAFVFYPQILDFLTGPYREVCKAENLTCPDRLVITDPLEGFAVRMKVTGYGGLVLALPVVLWQLWRFITPGLYENEKRYAIPFVVASVVLFLMGAGIALWTFPKALQFLVSWSGDVQPLFAPGAYLSLIMLLMLGFGIGFLFPVLLVALELVGIVTPQQLSGARRFAVVGIVVVVAVATPSGDPYSLLALSIPLILFYEVAIVIGKLAVRRRARSAAAAA